MRGLAAITSVGDITHVLASGLSSSGAARLAAYGTDVRPLGPEPATHDET